MKTIIAAFRDQATADQAIAFLHDKGLTDVELMSRETGDGTVKHLRELNVPDERAQLYADFLQRGAPIVAAQTDRDAEADEIAFQLDRMGSLDLDENIEQGGELGARSEETTGARTGREAEVIEERVAVGKREVSRGGVRVRTFVAERPVREQVQLTEERIDVQREPVNEQISPAAAEAAMGEEEFEVTARGEEVVVGKEARVVERIHVGKTAETRTETVEESERRQDVKVEPIDTSETRRDREPRR